MTPEPTPEANPEPGSATAVIPLSDTTGWLAALRSTGTYDSYHTPEYQGLTSGKGNQTILLAYRSRGVQAVVPLTLRPLPNAVAEATGYRYDATSVYGYPGPLRTSRDSTRGAPPREPRNSTRSGPYESGLLEIDDSWAAAFVAWFTEVMAGLRVLTAFIRCHPLLDASDMFRFEPFVVSPPTPTVAVDLTATSEDRLRRASSHHRRALRKSRSYDLTFLRDHSAAAVAGFTTCYLQTMHKHRSAASYLLDEERVHQMLDSLGDVIELWVARKPDGQVASAALFLRTNGILQYHLGGTRTEDYALGAARPLFEAVADSGHERGDRWFHLGGGVGGDDDSLFRYKAGFGPDRFAYRTIRAVFDDVAYEKAVGVAGHDRRSGFFPAYRTSGLGV